MIRVAFVIGDYPPAEKKLREDTAKSFSSAEVEVGILSVAPQPFGGRVWCCVSWGVDQAIGVNGNGARAIVNPRAWTAPLHGEARR